MILGISSFTYGWSIGVAPNSAGLSEVDLINNTRQFGLECLQVGDNLPLHILPREKLKDFKTSALNNNIRLEVGARKLTENHLQRYLDIAGFLEAPLLRFVVDENGYEPSRETIISILKNAIPELKKRRITLGVENHDRFKAKELASIMESISDDFIGICLDCVNSIGAGEGLEWVANLLAPYTVNLHIKDFNIKRLPHKMGFTVSGAPTGTGMLNLSWIMEKLSRYNRCQSAVLEQWVTPEQHLDETVRKENLWAEQGIRFLKQLPYFKTNSLP
jgi:sugar phosphate isomerase/epimerase